MQPTAYKGMLIRMATAFVKMHSALLTPQFDLLSEECKDILQRIALRELEGLALCWDELGHDEKGYADCCEGYFWATDELKRCFQL